MERKFGCLESPSDLRDYRICKSAMRIDLPEEFRLNNKNIKDQGSVNSCGVGANGNMTLHLSELYFFFAIPTASRCKWQYDTASL